MYRRLLNCLVCQDKVDGRCRVARSPRRAAARKRRHPRSSAILVAMLVASASAASALPAGAHLIARSASAHTARTLNANDTAHLHLVRSSGSLLYEEGLASGGLSGHMKADLNIGATFTGNFTIYTNAGTIKGHG